MDARFIGAVVAVILTGASAMAEVSGYAHRIDFSVTGYRGTETLVNFPLIIKLSETIKGFKYSDFLSDGADLRFALKDGTVLQHELESWDTTGTSVAWVKVPAFSNGLELTMYYGKAGDTAPEQTVFQDAGFKMVHHFAETEGNYADATGNGFSGTRITYGDETATSVVGLFGNAVQLGQGEQNAKGTSVKIVNWTSSGITDTFTYSTWIRYTKVGQAVADDCIAGSAQFRLDLNWGSPKDLRILSPDGTWFSKNVGNVFPGDANDGSWYNLAVSFCGTEAKVYVNGALKTTTTLPAPENLSANALGIGNNEKNDRPVFKGMIDETRVHPEVLSADWIAAEYDAATDEIGTFLSLYKKTIHVVPPSTPGHTAVAPYYTWETAATDIQTASDSNTKGLDVKIAPGTYPIASRLLLEKENVTYVCVDPTTDLPVFGGAVIDAGAQPWTASAVYLKDASIRGFRIVGATNTTASSLGAGLSVGAGRSIVADTVIESCCLSGSGGMGGGLGLSSDFRGVVTNCTVKDCAAAKGGGLYCLNTAADALSSHATVVGCTFERNLMNANWGNGGAGMVAGILLKDCNFIGNGFSDSSLSSYAACLHVGARVQIVGCLFDGNKSGGMYGTSCIYESESGMSQVIRGCTFVNNAAVLYSGYGLIEDSVFTNNLGEVLHLAPSLRNCLVVRNKGTALLCYGNVSTTNSIENCTIADNGSYGIQANSAGSLRTRIVNSIIIGNRYDYACWRANNDFVATNSILVTSNVEFSHDGSEDSNLWKFSREAIRFVDAASGDYRIARASKCRDVGVKLGWMTEDATDLAGNPRVLKDGRPAANALPDLGCYENSDAALGLLVILR